jgi:hypothetical protein
MRRRSPPLEHGLVYSKRAAAITSRPISSPALSAYPQPRRSFVSNWDERNRVLSGGRTRDRFDVFKFVGALVALVAMWALGVALTYTVYLIARALWSF